MEQAAKKTPPAMLDTSSYTSYAWQIARLNQAGCGEGGRTAPVYNLASFSCVMVYGNFRLKPKEASVLSVALFVPQGLNRIHTSRTPCRIGAENQTNRHGHGERQYRRPGRDDCREVEEMVHEVGEPNPQPDADQ